MEGVRSPTEGGAWHANRGEERGTRTRAVARLLLGAAMSGWHTLSPVYAADPVVPCVVPRIGHAQDV
eukprot:361791-Chlamydomonas_euryale.AAC.2